MENEQVNQESNDSVDTPVRDAQDVFAEMLTTESSDNDKNEVVNEEQEDIEENVEETEEETESEPEVEELEEDNPETEEDEDDESEDEEVEVEERKTFRVKANGEEKDLTIDELVEGYQKGSNYTQKSQQLAEEKKKVEAEAGAIQEAMQLREQYSARLSQVQQLLEQETNDGVDMDAMKENDPIAWSIAIATKTENNKKLQLLAQEQDRLAQAQQQQNAQHQAKMIAHESEMLSEKIREFSDPKKAEQLKGEIRNFGKSIGFTDNELAQVYDHRHVMVMQKAMEYDKLQKANPSVTKKLAKAPKMAKKGNKVANVDVYTKQKKRLKSSGKLTDAVDVFKNFI